MFPELRKESGQITDIGPADSQLLKHRAFHLCRDISVVILKINHHSVQLCPVDLLDNPGHPLHASRCISRDIDPFYFYGFPGAVCAPGIVVNFNHRPGSLCPHSALIFSRFAGSCSLGRRLAFISFRCFLDSPPALRYSLPALHFRRRISCAACQGQSCGKQKRSKQRSLLSSIFKHNFSLFFYPFLSWLLYHFPPACASQNPSSPAEK